MARKTTVVGPFLGMNNRLPDTAMKSGDRGDFLRNAVNVDVTSAGTVKRRVGFVLGMPYPGAHSLWGDGDYGYFAEGPNLHRITGRDSVSGWVWTGDVVLYSQLASGLPISFCRAGDDIYFSNGVQSGRIAPDGLVYPWGIPVPPTPIVTAGAGGSLPEGLYQVSLTYVASDGEESGASFPVQVSVPAGGVIDLMFIPSPLGHSARLYVSPQNGDTLFRYSALPNTMNTAQVSVQPATDAVECRTLFLSPPPAGTIIRHLNGRVYIANGRFLYYTEPFALSYHDARKGFIAFPADITVVEDCQNGLYVAADQTYWIDGDPSGADLNPVLPYGAVRGCSGQVPNANSVFWYSERGFIVGDQTGKVENRQEAVIAADAAAFGSVLFHEHDGMRQLVSSLFNSSASVAAAGSYMDAEILRKETLL